MLTGEMVERTVDFSEFLFFGDEELNKMLIDKINAIISDRVNAAFASAIDADLLDCYFSIPYLHDSEISRYNLPETEAGSIYATWEMNDGDEIRVVYKTSFLDVVDSLIEATSIGCDEAKGTDAKTAKRLSLIANEMELAAKKLKEFSSISDAGA